MALTFAAEGMDREELRDSCGRGGSRLAIGAVELAAERER